MTFHDFGDVNESFHHLLIHTTTFKVNAYIGTSTIAQRFGVHIETTTGNHALVGKTLHTLVDGCTRDVAFCCYVFERNPRVFREDVQDFLVQTVNLVHLIA